MNAGRLATLILSMFVLAGCGAPEVECTSIESEKVVTKILQDQLAGQLRHSSDFGGGDNELSPSEIRAAVARLKFTIASIRTASRDPNSTKRFCEGTLKVVFPVEYLTRSETRRETLALASLERLEESLNVERSANSVSAPIAFSVQPTDDGQDLFAETEKQAPVISYLSQLVGTALLREMPIPVATHTVQERDDDSAFKARQARQTIPPAYVYPPHRPTVVVIDPSAESNDF